jgi:hypothetical protein
MTEGARRYGKVSRRDGFNALSQWIEGRQIPTSERLIDTVIAKQIKNGIGLTSLSIELAAIAACSSSSSRRLKMSALTDQPSVSTILSTDEARQGVTGHNVRYVLGVGIAGAVITFVVIGFVAAQGWL